MKRSSKTAGTSFYNTILKATPQELIDALGKPHYFDNTGMSKTNMEYNLETSNGIHFTIYDWKEYREYSNDELIEWHIGGHQSKDAIKGMKELEAALRSV